MRLPWYTRVTSTPFALCCCAVFVRVVCMLVGVRRDCLVEASRKDLVGANSEQTATLVAAVLKKAKGGVLLLSDAASYADKTDHYGNLALSLVVTD